MKVNNWLKIAVVTIIIMTFIFSYSLFFIDFTKIGQQQQSQQQFQGPKENPPENFQLPQEAPTAEGPNSEPPNNY